MQAKIDFVKTLVSKAQHIAVLTGAGVSTDAGIADFKSTDETWPYDEPRDALISAPYWRHYPKEFWEVYRYAFAEKLDDSSKLQPTAFHRWLAELEKTKKVSIITQNVDGLHQLAGSTEVIEAHGNSSRTVCLVCEERKPMAEVKDIPVPICGSDKCTGLLLSGKPSILKPDVSLFFEGVNGMGKFRKILKKSDLLIVAGTRLQVGPINELPYVAMAKNRYTYQPTVWLNSEEPPNSYSFTKVLLGEMADLVESLTS